MSITDGPSANIGLLPVRPRGKCKQSKRSNSLSLCLRLHFTTRHFRCAQDRTGVKLRQDRTSIEYILIERLPSTNIISFFALGNVDPDG